MRASSRPNRPFLAGLGVGLAVLAFLALNTWATLDLRGRRLDLTANRQYTLSPATLRLLGGIEEPVTLRLYVSSAIREANPLLWSYAGRVADLLEGYEEASGGRVRLERVDPEPFSAEEDRAVGFGLQAIGLDAAGSAGYLGLAGTNSTDDIDVLPVLSPEREPFLEYDLTRLVFNLAEPDKPVVAMVTDLPLNGDPARQYRPWQVYEQLGQFFDIRVIGGDVEAFDPEVDLLLLVHPAALSDKTLFAIDQFALGGGRVMAFLDPHSEAAAVRQRTPVPGPAESSLAALTAAWGVELVAGEVVGDPAYARQVGFPSGGRQQVVDYLPWLALGGPALARDQVATAELERLNLATAGILRRREGATTELLPLLTSSPEAQRIPVEKVATYPDPLALIREYAAGGEPLVMAARVTGPARSAFPDALPDGVAAPAERLLESREPLNLVIVADTDLLEDRLWLAAQSAIGQSGGVPVADNANFAANALDFLAGSEALAALRGRDVQVRPFTRVEDLRRRAEQAYRAKEQELLARLDDVQRKLASLEVGGAGEAAAASAAGGTAAAAGALSAAQQGEIEGFRTQLVETRRELREVRRALRSDIEALRDNLRLANVAGMPAAVAVVAILLAIAGRWRSRRRFRAADEAAAPGAARAAAA